MYNVSLKIYAEPNVPRELSKKSILRYVNYKLEKIHSKKFLEQATGEKFSLVVNQRTSTTDVKLVTSFKGKNIKITTSDSNPYKAIQLALNKYLNKTLKISKSMVEEKRRESVKNKEMHKEAIFNEAENDFITDLKQFLNTEDYIADSADFREYEASAYEADLLEEESEFLKLIEEYSALE